MHRGRPIPNGKKLDTEFVAKDGRTVTFTFARDVERENRGFVIDEAVAWIGDEPAGYLYAEYVCGKRFASFYPSGILNFMAQISGQLVLPIDKERMDVSSASPEELAQIARKLVGYKFARESPEAFGSHEEFQQWLKAATANSVRFENVAKEFEDFKKRIDAPFVAYVCTKGNDLRGFRTNFEGLGIGTALYKVMAVELDKLGMRLRASSLQQPRAEAIWKKFEIEGIAYREGSFLYLDADKCSLESPLTIRAGR